MAISYITAAIEILTMPGGPSNDAIEGVIRCLQEELVIRRRRSGEVDMMDREAEAREIERAEGWTAATLVYGFTEAADDDDFEAYVHEQMLSYKRATEEALNARHAEARLERMGISARYRDYLETEGPIEDEDGTIAHMRMLERNAERDVEDDGGW